MASSISTLYQSKVAVRLDSQGLSQGERMTAPKVQVSKDSDFRLGLPSCSTHAKPPPPPGWVTLLPAEEMLLEAVLPGPPIIAWQIRKVVSAPAWVWPGATN